MSHHYDLPDSSPHDTDGTPVGVALALALLAILLTLSGIVCYSIVQLTLWLVS